MSTHSIYVEWAGQGEHFTGHNPSGPTIEIDTDKLSGTSPMILLLHAEAGCTGLDVVSLMEKMRQPMTGLKIEVEAIKGDGEFPRVWEKIHLRYIFQGNLELEKVTKAVNLSLEKYCSVSAMLSQTADVSHEIVILPSA